MEKKNFSLKTAASVWRNYSFIFVFIAIMIVYAATIQANGNSFNWGHISSILSSQNTVIVGTMAFGMAFIIITGQIDLSVGSSLVLCTGATIVAFNKTDNVFVMVLVALLSGLVCSCINGLLVAYAKMPSFIVTLGTMLIYRSIALSLVREIDPALSGSSSSLFDMISEKNNYDFLRMKFGTGSLRLGQFAIPYISILLFLIVLLFIFISRSTKYGKSVYAVGSNEKAAHLAGIRVQWTKFSVFMVMGLLIGVASIIQACKIGNITPASSAQSFEMYAIASVVLGGISMMGGRGNMLGVLFGALSYTTINSIIVSVPNFTTDSRNAFQGIVLILVVFVQTAGPTIREKLLSFRRPS